MKKKSIVFAIILILLAVYLIVSRIGYAPALPFFTVAFTVVFLYTTIMGLVRLNFVELFTSLAILGCIHDERLGITALTPWTLWGAAILLAIAFEMIFKGVKKNRGKGSFSFEYDSDRNSRVEDFVDGECVRVENHFGACSKYVNSENFTSADIESSFGECNVYFNNAILAGSRARIRVENNFGETNVYLPRTWQIDEKQNCAFGSVKIHGSGSTQADAPLIELLLECNFGEIEVFFE